MKRLDRETTVALAAGIVIIAVLAFAINAASSANRRMAQIKAQGQELQSIKEEFVAASRRVKAFEARKSLTRVEGVQQAVDEVLKSVGMRGKVKSVKDIDSPEGEKAEVSLKDIDMNEMVNILYAFEHAPMPLVVTKAELRTSFQKQGLFNMSLTILLIKDE